MQFLSLRREIMPNGFDRNWVRVRAAIHGYRIRHAKWPIEIHVSEGVFRDLQDNVFLPKTFSKVKRKLIFILDGKAIVAENGEGLCYSYGDEGFPKMDSKIDAEKWLGVNPDRESNED
jgi:hypothetical protein